MQQQPTIARYEDLSCLQLPQSGLEPDRLFRACPLSILSHTHSQPQPQPFTTTAIPVPSLRQLCLEKEFPTVVQATPTTPLLTLGQRFDADHGTRTEL